MDRGAYADNRLWQRLWGLVFSTSLLLSLLLATSQAQGPTTIAPDASLGTTVTQSGTIYTVTGGTRPGNGPNLFHSFDRFSVGTGDTALFSASGQTGIANILSRVTGGQPSAIYGQLQSTMPGANLFLLNPSGVMFGPNAKLDVSGSFHASTADFLRFADGGRFFANLSQDSVLTVAAPTAFGFLGRTPAPITMQGSELEVPTGRALSVVGGDLQIVGGRLRAPSGRLQLASVASPGDVGFSPLELAPDLRVASFARLGRLTLSQGAHLDASGTQGGTVLLRGGRLLMNDNASITVVSVFTSGSTNSASAGIDLQIATDLTLSNEAQITTDNLGAGRAGELRITAGSLYMDRATIRSSPFFVGEGGNIVIRVSNLTLTGGAQIDSSTRGAGRGAQLNVTATETILIAGRDREDRPSGLFSTTLGQGPGGDLQVEARHIQLYDGGAIAASSSGDGAAGMLLIQVGETFRSQDGAVTTAATQAGGGTIALSAGQLVQLRDSRLTTSVRGGSGAAGNLTLTAPLIVAENSRLIAQATEGMGGNIQINARAFLADPTSLVDASSAVGLTGTVDIRAPVTSLSGTLAPLPQAFVNVAALLPARCAVRLSEGKASSIVLGGRGGFPVEPGGALPSPLIVEERLSADPALMAAQPPPRAAAAWALLTNTERHLPRLPEEPPARGCVR